MLVLGGGSCKGTGAVCWCCVLVLGSWCSGLVGAGARVADAGGWCCGLVLVELVLGDWCGGLALGSTAVCCWELVL